MFEDWSRRTDDEVFKDASEQPGPQASYYRGTEISRRLYLLEKANLEAQRALLQATLEGITEQRSATQEMRRQSKLMFASVVAAFLLAFFTLVAAWIE